MAACRSRPPRKPPPRETKVSTLNPPAPPNRLDRLLTFLRVSFALTLWDFIAALLAPYLALVIRNFFISERTLDFSFGVYAVSCAIATLALLRISGVAVAAWRFFSFPDASAAFNSIAMGVLVGAMTAFFFDRLASVPRMVPFIHIALQSVMYIGPRYLLKRTAERLRPTQIIRPLNVLLIGCNQTAYVYARAIESIGQGALKIAGVLTHDPTMVGHTLRGIEIVGMYGAIEQVISKFKTHGVDIGRIIVAASEKEISPSNLNKIIQFSRDAAIPVTDIHLLFTEVAGPVDFADEFDIDAIHLRGAYWPWKRLMDIFAAGALMISLAPLFLVAAVLVYFDLGRPLLFWQRRLGRQGRAFNVLKFRTMRNEGDGSRDRATEDARTTKVGAFLRLSRLDELPQLVNILYGDMSFIGPRPLLPSDQPEEVSQRLAARPGISGWAQVNGGKLVSPEEKRALDLWYIAHASLRLDLLIVVKTLLVMLRGDRLGRGEISQAIQWLASRETEAQRDFPVEA